MTNQKAGLSEFIATHQPNYIRPLVDSIRFALYGVRSPITPDHFILIATGRL